MKAIILTGALLAIFAASALSQSSTTTDGQSPAASASSSASSTNTTAPTETSEAQKKKKTLRIGVAQIISTVSSSLETDGWQQQLVDDIDFLGGQGVILSADPNDREGTMAEGKDRNCDYVVFTTVTNFKSVGVGQKLGGVLGRGGLGGVGGTGQGRVEIAANVKVFQPDNIVPILDVTDDFRQNDSTATVQGLLHTEAREVMLQLRKQQSGNPETNPKPGTVAH